MNAALDLLALLASSPSPTLLVQAPLAPKFAAPVRLKAGDELLGHELMYPSPVFHDVNGDGLLDLVVGDLVGRLGVALRQPGKDAYAYGASTELQAADGKPIDFHNW
jgi:hypothetical protein